MANYNNRGINPDSKVEGDLGGNGYFLLHFDNVDEAV